MQSKRTWPDNMGFLSNKTFEQIYNTNPEYVRFSRKHITNPTGTFKLWMEYLDNKK